MANLHFEKIDVTLDDPDYGKQFYQKQLVRAKVVGGWIVSYHIGTGKNGLVFISDPKHTWLV